MQALIRALNSKHSWTLRRASLSSKSAAMFSARSRKSARWTCTCLSSPRTAVLSLVLATALLIPATAAQRNITIYANDPSLLYSPSDAWETVGGQVLGDGSARVTRRSGARVSLPFRGTAVYFQTTRAERRGTSRIELDEAAFRLDSSLDGQDKDVGVLWGILSLNDTEHTITVTQSAAEGIELAVNAFIYTTTSDNVQQAPIPSPPPIQATPGFFDPSNISFKRNIALIAGSSALLIVLVLLIVCIIKRRARSSNGNINKAAIRLAVSPTSPFWKYKSFNTIDTSGKKILAPSERIASTLQTPSSAAFLLKRSHSDSGSVSSTSRIISLQPSSPYTPEHALPERHEVQAAHAPNNQERARITLPPLVTVNQRFSHFSTGATAASTEPSSPMLAVGRASSALEHDTRLSPLPELPSPISPPQAFTRDTLLHLESGSAGVPRSPFILQESENEGLILRLSPRSADISARLPAGFSVVRPPSPPPAYQDGGGSSSASRSWRTDAKGS